MIPATKLGSYIEDIEAGINLSISMKSVWDKSPLLFIGTTPNSELIFKRLQPVDIFVHRLESGADVALMIPDVAAFSLRRCNFLAQQRRNAAQTLGVPTRESIV